MLPGRVFYYGRGNLPGAVPGRCEDFRNPLRDVPTHHGDFLDIFSSSIRGLYGRSPECTFSRSKGKWGE